MGPALDSKGNFNVNLCTKVTLSSSRLCLLRDSVNCFVERKCDVFTKFVRVDAEPVVRPVKFMNTFYESNVPGDVRKPPVKNVYDWRSSKGPGYFTSF